MTTPPRLVMKFGGTSVADMERIRNAAARVKREVEAGYHVAVVVSAMAGETNRLVGYVREAAATPGANSPGFYDAREYDSVVASGEQVTSGLMAIVLQEMDVPARSWAGWQAPVMTTSAHGSARITGIDTTKIEERFGQGMHAVIAGFQGVSPEGRITTLGRGGSDTSAVAFAAALGAERCDIYTDVDGVYTTDPRIERKARKLSRISFEEMLELASLGAKVLQTRSVELAMNHKVKLMVRSSFSDDPGTLVCPEEESVEKNVVSGIAAERGQAKITLLKVADRPGVAASIFGPLAEGGVNVDMIVQNISEDGSRTDMTFTVPSSDAEKALAVLAGEKQTIGYDVVQSESGLAKVSVIGIGMRSHAGVAATAFKALAEKSINIKAITTSEIKISILIDGAYAELAVRTLHSVYGLDKT